MAQTSLPHPLTTTQLTPSALRRRAAALDCRAEQLYAEAAVSARYGNAENAVRRNAMAVACENEAECLRLRAQRIADMAVDTREMAAEGATRDEIASYLQRTYGTAVARG